MKNHTDIKEILALSVEALGNLDLRSKLQIKTILDKRIFELSETISTYYVNGSDDLNIYFNVLEGLETRSSLLTKMLKS